MFSVILQKDRILNSISPRITGRGFVRRNNRSSLRVIPDAEDSGKILFHHFWNSAIRRRSNPAFVTGSKSVTLGAGFCI